jgi:hypothetical protein
MAEGDGRGAGIHGIEVKRSGRFKIDTLQKLVKPIHQRILNSSSSFFRVGLYLKALKTCDTRHVGRFYPNSPHS